MVWKKIFFPPLTSLKVNLTVCKNFHTSSSLQNTWFRKLSADYRKKFGPRSQAQNHQAWSVSKLIDTLVVFKISSTCNQPAQLQRLSIILNILKVANEFVLYYRSWDQKMCWFVSWFVGVDGLWPSQYFSVNLGMYKMNKTLLFNFTVCIGLMFRIYSFVPVLNIYNNRETKWSM